MKISHSRALSLLLLIFWVLLVLGGYYYIHKPLDLQTIRAPITAALALAAGLGVVVVAGGIGRRILCAVSLQPLERAAVQSALGAGVTGILWLALGSAGLLYPWLAWLVMLAGFLLLRKEILFWLSDTAFVFKSWQDAGRLEKFFAVIVSILFLQQLFLALAPPLKWDALTYHLQLPRLYIAAGNTHYISDNPYWGSPQIAEMVITFSNLLLQNSSAGAVTGWGFGIVFFTGVLGITGTYLARIKKVDSGSNAGWAAVAALAAGLTVRSELGWSYTDLYAALFGLGALITLFEWLDSGRLSCFRWACLFSGFAISVKWTAGVMLLGIFLGVLFLRRPVLDRLKLVVQGGLIALAPVIPWLVKNAAATGNPIFPYFLSSPNFSAERISAANDFQQSLPWLQRIFLPFSLTFTGVEGAAGFSTDSGPLLLLLGLPGLLFFWREQKARWLAGILLPALLVIGLFGQRLGHLFQPRLYFVVLSAAAVLAGWGWFTLQSQVFLGVRLRRLFGTLLALVLILALFQDSRTFAKNSPLSVILGGISSEYYLENGLGAYAYAMRDLEQLPPESRILMLWEPRGYYAPLNAQPDLWIDRWKTDRREQQTPDRIIGLWKSQGFTHILVYLQGETLINPSMGSAAQQEWATYQQVMGRLSLEKEIGGWYKLYVLP